MWIPVLYGTLLLTQCVLSAAELSLDRDHSDIFVENMVTKLVYRISSTSLYRLEAMLIDEFTSELYFNVDLDDSAHSILKPLYLEPGECQQIEVAVKPLQVGDDIKLKEPLIEYSSLEQASSVQRAYG